MPRRKQSRRRKKLSGPPATVPIVTSGDIAKREFGSQWITDDLIEYTRRVWSKQYGRPISVDEAIEINVNVKRFAELLVRIKRENEANIKTCGETPAFEGLPGG